MSTSAARVAYIRKHYALNPTPSGWEAVSTSDTGPAMTISGPERAGVVRTARCQWGHFNFADEADAFFEIFR